MRTVNKNLPRLVQVLFVAVVCCSCSKGKSVEKSPPPLGARTGLIAGLPTAKLDVGEDCSKFEGNDACVSGLCLRVKAGIPPKAFCSIRCRPQKVDQCPDGPSQWACRQVWPSEAGWVCVPDMGWTGGRATYKGGSVPLPSPTVNGPPDAGGVPLPTSVGPATDGGTP